MAGSTPARGLPARVLLTSLAFLVALPMTATLVFVLVLFLAGPHGGVLPASAEKPVLAVGWLLVILVPAFVARKTWVRLRHPRAGEARQSRGQRAAIR